MTFLLLPLQQSQMRVEVRNHIGIIFLQFLQSCACAPYSYLCMLALQFLLLLNNPHKNLLVAFSPYLTGSR